MSISFSTIIQKARPMPVAATSQVIRSALGFIPPTTVSTLGNGVRVACEENPLSEFATIGLWMDIGSRFETRETNGITRVLQQCGLQSTANANQATLSRRVEELGGHLVVDAGREYSYIAFITHKSNAEKAVSLLAEVTRNASLSDRDIEAAKKKVNTMRNDNEEDIDSIVDDNLHIGAFDATEHGGLGLSVWGDKRCINSLTREQLNEYRELHYTGPRMVLVGTGGVDHTNLEKLAATYLGNAPEVNHKSVTMNPTRFVGGDVRLWNLRMKTTHVSFGFETAGAISGDSTAISLAGHIYGSSHRSQHELTNHALARTLKVFSSMDHGTPTNTPFPEQGIETLTPFHHSYTDSGLFGMYFVGRIWKTGPGGAYSVLDSLNLAMSDHTRLAQKGIHEREFEQAKINYKAQLLYNTDGATNSAKDIGQQLLSYGRRVPLEEMYDRIDDITTGNMQEVLQHYITGRRPIVSMTGYIFPIFNYDALMHWTYKPWY